MSTFAHMIQTRSLFKRFVEMAGVFNAEISFDTHILMILSTLTTLMCLITTYHLYFSTIFQGGKFKYPKFLGGWVSYKLCEYLLYYH